MRLHACATLALTVALAACGPSTADDAPAGGVLRLRDALAAQDVDRVWNQLAPETQQVCADALAALRHTDSQISLLQPSDQVDARRSTGVDALPADATPAQLFAVLVHVDALPSLDADSSHFRGMSPVDQVDIADDVAVVVTDAKQEFEMRRGADGQWLVREPLYSLVTQAVAPIVANRDAVDEAVRLFGVGVEVDEELRQLGLLR
ncbi:MAG: hypothetical protein H6699_06330 [Myxococcales bacterium]|nr:hypothetical protein [Myxococcales bacterium]